LISFTALIFLSDCTRDNIYIIISSKEEAELCANVVILNNFKITFDAHYIQLFRRERFMRIDITGKDIKIGDQLRERIEKKLAKFDRYFDDKAVATVRIKPDHNNTVCVEITMKIHKHYYRAETTADEILTALDQSVDIMEGQIRKHKSRLQKRTHDFAYMKEFLRANFDEDDFEEEDEFKEENIEIIRRKRFVLTPMSPEEAVLQCEMLGHSFLLYLSPETGKVCVVYKRKDGNYGLLEPEY
jgi:putative sigma-54 modulation protein